MKRILAAVAMLVLTASASYAQDVTPALMRGSKALLFEFDGLNTLRANNFDGGAGLKFYLSEMEALRIGFRFTRGSADTPANPVAPNTGIDGSQNGSTFGGSIALERHLRTARVSPFLGGGALFSTTSTESKNVVIGNPPGPQTTVKNSGLGETIGGTTFQGGTTFGVFGLFGFEFFLTRDVSFAAEYRLGFGKTSRKDQEVTTGATTTTTKIGGATLLGVTSSGLFTMAVYF